MVNTKTLPDWFIDYAKSVTDYEYLFYSKKGGILKVYCPKCEHTDANYIELTNVRANGSGRCASCESEGKFKNVQYSHNDAFACNTIGYFESSGDTVMFSAYRIRIEFEGCRGVLARKAVVSNIEHYLEISFKKGEDVAMCSRIAPSYNPYGANTVYIPYYWKNCRHLRDYMDCHINPDSITALKSSHLGKYAELLIDTCGESKALGIRFSDIETVQMLINTIEKPMFSKLLKHKLYTLAWHRCAEQVQPNAPQYGYRNSYLMNPSSNYVSWNCRKLSSFLKLDVSRLSNINASLLGYRELNAAREIVATGDKACEAGIAINLDSYNYVKILTFYNDRQIDTSKLKKYLKKQHGVCGKNVCRDYADYLEECVKLGFDMGDRSVLYPRQLLVAHERTSAAVRELKDMQKREEYADAVAKWAGVEHISGGISITLISTIEQLEQEAKQLSNCAYGYSGRIIRGDSVLFTIKSLTDTPIHLMAELDPNELEVVQCRGAGNVDGLEDATIKQFIFDWLKGVVVPHARKSKRKKAQKNKKQLALAGA